MLNGDFLNDQAAELADRLRREGRDDVRGRSGGRCGWPWPGDPDERSVRARAGLDPVAAARSSGRPPTRALNYYCLMVLNLNEFVYLD